MATHQRRASPRVGSNVGGCGGAATKALAGRGVHVDSRPLGSDLDKETFDELRGRYPSVTHDAATKRARLVLRWSWRRIERVAAHLDAHGEMTWRKGVTK